MQYLSASGRSARISREADGTRPPVAASSRDLQGKDFVRVSSSRSSRERTSDAPASPSTGSRGPIDVVRGYTRLDSTVASSRGLEAKDDIVRRLSQEAGGPQSSGDSALTSAAVTRFHRILHRSRSFGDSPLFSQKDAVVPFEKTDLRREAPDPGPVGHSDRFDAANSMERREAPDGPTVRDSQRLLQKLGYTPSLEQDKAVETIREIYKALRSIATEQKRLDQLKETLVKDSPKPTSWRRVKHWNFPKKAYIEWQIDRWEVQFKGPRDTSTWSGWTLKRLDQANKPLKWTLEKTGLAGTLGLSAVQSAIGTTGPSYIAKKWLWGLMVLGYVPSLTGNKLFKEWSYPLGPLANTIQFEGWNIAGTAFQNKFQPTDVPICQIGNSIISQVDNSTTIRVDNSTKRELGEIMAERHSTFKRELTTDEIVDMLLNSIDELNAQGGHSTMGNW